MGNTTEFPRTTNVELKTGQKKTKWSQTEEKKLMKKAELDNQ